MATKTKTIVYSSGETSKKESNATWGINFSTLKNLSIQKIPKYSEINSVNLKCDLKRDGDMNSIVVYNGSVSFRIKRVTRSTNDDGTYSWSSSTKEYATATGGMSTGNTGITTSFKTFSTNKDSNFSTWLKAYMNSGTEDVCTIDTGSVSDQKFGPLSISYGTGVQVFNYTIRNREIIYEITLPTLTINSSVGGTVSNSGTYNIDTEVSSDSVVSISCSANPSAGYRFLQWSDGNTSQTRTFSQSDLTSTNTIITAQFIPYYTIIYNLDGGNTSETRINFYDSLYGALNSNLSPIGISEIILPEPSKTGYSFIGWTGTNIEKPSKVVTIPIGSSGNRSYTANWQINQYKVTINCSPEDSGIAKIILKDGTEFSNSSKLLDYGTSLTAISATTTDVDKYVFSRFTITGKVDSLNNTLSGQVVPAYDIAYTAYFNLRKYAVTASSVLISYDEDGNEIETQEDCAVFELNNLSTFTPQEYGKTIYISFLPKFGYKFVKWKNTETSKMNKAVLETVVTGEIKAVACFEKIEPINNSIPSNIEDLPFEDKNNLITSIADSIINKTIINYINTVKMSSIGDYIFYNCDKLKFINIPNVNSSALGSYAFYGCKNLTSLRLPVNITELKDNAFENCINLTTLIIPNSSLVKLTSPDVFLNTPFNNSLYNQSFGYIYVPMDLKSEYQTATNWALYADKFRAIEDYPEICGG